MIRVAALVLTVLTGFSGLVYEVTWQKCLATLLGSHSEATAAVLGIYLGGLSAGYALFGNVVRRMMRRAEESQRPPPLLHVYGAVEAGIGMWALVFPLLFEGVQSLSLLLAIENTLLAFVLDVFLTALLIGPPTVLMGGTIPILTQALSRSVSDATRFHAFVYGFNTAGAFAGALAAAFILIPALGIHSTLFAMGTINITAGGLFALLGRRSDASAFVDDTTPAAVAPRGFALFAAAACLLGFAMMSVQTVLIRVGGLALGASHFTFATVVAVFVACLALGSLAVSSLTRIPRWAVVACPALLALFFGGLYLALPNTPYAAHVLRTFFSAEPAAFHPYYVAIFLGVLGVLAVPVGLSGASLPLLFHEVRREIGDLGAVAGRLYSWNTVGNLLGALLGGYALLFWLDLHHVYRLGVAATVAATLLLAVRSVGLSAAAAAILAVPLGYALVALPPWPPERMSSGSFRLRTPTTGTYDGAEAFYRARATTSRIVFSDDDPTTTVIVRERMFGSRMDRSVWTNGKSDGSLVIDYPTMALVTLVPCILAEQCESAFVIGFGTGVSVGEFAVLEDMERVDVAEISGGVLDAAEYFEFGNQAVLQRDNVRLLRSDAYRALMRSDTKYDVIASEPSNPWTSGVEMLFSFEFLSAARDRLKPGGVFAQWFHVYETDTQSIQLVMNTYREVFDHVAVWYALGHDLLLLGWNGTPNLDLDRMARHSARSDVAAGLARAGIRQLPGLLIHELMPLGTLPHARLGNEVHTLFHPILSDRAARAFFSGRTGDLPFTATRAGSARAAETSLFAEWLRRAGSQATDEELAAAANQVCQMRNNECTTFMAWWRQRDPGPAFEEVRARWERHPDRREYLQDELIDEVALLFTPRPAGATTPEDVLRQIELFERHYFHATPFPRENIELGVARCRGQECANARARAEHILGR